MKQVDKLKRCRQMKIEKEVSKSSHLSYCKDEDPYFKKIENGSRFSGKVNE